MKGDETGRSTETQPSGSRELHRLSPPASAVGSAATEARHRPPPPPRETGSTRPSPSSTASRCRMERVVLAIQDTTTLNYNGLSATSGLDELGGGGKGTSGILAHCGIAINAAGRPLGMFAMDATFRRAERKDSARWVKGLDRARELSAACPNAPPKEGRIQPVHWDTRNVLAALAIFIRIACRCSLRCASGVYSLARAVARLDLARSLIGSTEKTRQSGRRDSKGLAYLPDWIGGQAFPVRDKPTSSSLESVTT